VDHDRGRRDPHLNTDERGHPISSRLDTLIPDNFLGLPDEASGYTQARVLILPIPFEATATYGLGTVRGSAAIIQASRQVEFYDREFDCEPGLIYGIHTLPALALPDDPASAVDAIARAVAGAASTGKLVVGLGGEHTISVGFGRGLLQAIGGPLTIVQIDAHHDLRDEYGGSPYSHACTARRLYEETGIEQIVQLGVRLVNAEEVAFARAHRERLRVWHADEVHAGGWQVDLAARLRGRRVYLTIDVDGLDPSIVPATGTPAPDGLTWREMMDVVRTVAQAGQIVGIDCVELAPVSGLHAADYAVAVMLYRTLSYAMGFSPKDEHHERCQ
jgi:agmatinase